MIIRNFSWLLFGQVAYRGLYFLLISILSLKFNLKDYAILTFSFLSAGLWNPIFNFGLGIIGVRDIAQNKISAISFFQRTIFLKVILAIIVSILICIYTFFFINNVRQQICYILICLSTVGVSFAEYFHIPFLATNRMNVVAFLVIAERTFLTITGLITVYFFNDIVIFSQVYFASSIAIVFMVMLYSYMNGIFVFQGTHCKIDYSYLRSSFPIGLNMFFVIAYSRFGLFFLKGSNDDYDLAYYNSAFFIVFMMQTLLATLMQSIFPNLSKSVVLNKSGLLLKLNNVLRLVYPVTILCISFVIVFEEYIFKYAFGFELLETLKILNLIIWVLPFYAISTIIANFFRANNGQGIVAKVTFVGVLINLLLCIALFKYGTMGIGLAYVISEFIIFCIMYLIWSKMYSSINRVWFLIILLNLTGITVLNLYKVDTIYFLIIIIPLIIIILISVKKKYEYHRV